MEPEGSADIMKLIYLDIIEAQTIIESASNANRAKAGTEPAKITKQIRAAMVAKDFLNISFPS
ncbi:hypothetical protein [Paenibacillus sp. GP183]|uniref:hypothetical protein n=1 Tax=Paenibacillus sp. GP183 TaxID=1882751 RepID=UPI000B85BD86|nr:hypothetical protein [Paenibacillus sp. GP183]